MHIRRLDIYSIINARLTILGQPETLRSMNIQSKISAADLVEYLFDGTVAITPLVAEKLGERVRIWGNGVGNNQIELAALLTGPKRIQGEQNPDIITEFFELPTYNSDKRNHLIMNMDDVEKVDREYPVRAFFHSHPCGNVVPTLNDWITFLYIDFRVLRRPILYVIMAPDGNKVIFSFKKCHESKDCPLSLLKNIDSITTERR